VSEYFAVITKKDGIRYKGAHRPIWEFLDEQPDGWLTSIARTDKYIPEGGKMIWDCGAWTYRNDTIPYLNGERVTARWAWQQYCHFARPGDRVVAPDHMVIEQLGNLDERRAFNHLNAVSFYEIAKDTHLIPMAVAHGTSVAERLQSVEDLLDIGYERIALGGLAGQARRLQFVVEAVVTVVHAFPQARIHVLGISAGHYARIWHHLNVESFDGSGYFYKAFTAGIYYRWTGTELVVNWASRPGEEIRIAPCGCGVCTLLREEGIDTRSYGSAPQNMGRAVHNMNCVLRSIRWAMSTPLTSDQLSLLHALAPK
jgi:hypothetical protein